MKLVKTTFYSAVITFVRVVSGFIASKVVAIVTGPAGVAFIGTFTNFIALTLTFANGAINNGIIKYTAEFEGDENTLKNLFSTSFKISIYCSVVLGAILISFAPFIANILANGLYINPIRVLGATIILYSLNTLLVSILNGKKQINTYTVVNMAGSLVGLLLTVVLVYKYGLQGALYALTLSQSIVFFLTATLIIKSPWFSWEYFKQPFDRELGKKLGGFSSMSLITAVTVPCSQILLRNMIMHRIGVAQAGYWQGVMRVSDGYLLLIVTALSVYYLPKLSSLKTDQDLRKEIFAGYKIILPTVLISCAVIYFLRFLIIRVLYTNSFLEMESLFFWQLLGDFFKIAAWILSYLMLAKAMTKVYIITDIFFSISYVVLGYLSVHWFKLQGITIAFAINYFLYFLTMLFIFRKLIFAGNATK